MVGLAPSASAVKTLVAKAVIKSEILQRFLPRMAKGAKWLGVQLIVRVAGWRPVATGTARLIT